MIVPRNRLLFWVAVVVVPFSLLWAVAPSSGAISLLALATLGVLALMDALAAGRGLAGLKLELPAVVRMSKDREAKIQVRVGNPNQQARTLRVGLALPVGI